MINTWWKMNPGVLGMPMTIIRSNAALANQDIGKSQKKWQELLAKHSKRSIVVLKKSTL
jgi:hypothetical protein